MHAIFSNSRIPQRQRGSRPTFNGLIKFVPDEAPWSANYFGARAFIVLKGLGQRTSELRAFPPFGNCAVAGRKFERVVIYFSGRWKIGWARSEITLGSALNASLRVRFVSHRSTNCAFYIYRARSMRNWWWAVVGWHARTAFNLQMALECGGHPPDVFAAACQRWKIGSSQWKMPVDLYSSDVDANGIRTVEWICQQF